MEHFMTSLRNICLLQGWENIFCWKLLIALSFNFYCAGLWYICLENPRNGKAWWAAIYGVAQSWTWLKRLRSSSMIYLELNFWILWSRVKVHCSTCFSIIYYKDCFSTELHFLLTLFYSTDLFAYLSPDTMLLKLM